MIISLLLYLIFVAYWFAYLVDTLKVKTKSGEIIDCFTSNKLLYIIIVISIFWIVAIPLYIIPLQKQSQE
jgi:hypothetical protein